MTAEVPKALLEVGGRTLLGWQVRELVACGVRDVVVVSGFQAPKIEAELAVLAERHPTCTFRAVHNPFYTVADNLASCWMVRHEMDSEFLLLNGDTLFEASVLRALLGSPDAPITLAVDEKAHYDEDDMKISRQGTRLLEIGKTLPSDIVDGESIGMLYFRGEGPARFVDTLEIAMQDTAALRQWYLSTIGEMARHYDVRTQLIAGFKWCEVDYPLDLERARDMIATVAEGETQAAKTAEGRYGS